MALPPFLDSFVNGPRLPKVVLGIFGLVVIAGLGYFFGIAPLEQEVSGLQTRLAALQRDLVQSRAQVAEIARFRAEVAELEKRLEAVKEKLPTAKETPPLYRTIHEAAVRSGLSVSLFQPRAPQPRDYYSEIPIVLSAEGSYHDLGQFMDRVARLPRVVTLIELKATGLPQSPRSLRADLVLATYMYLAPSAAPAPAPAAPRPQGASR